jgi:RNA polymerase sigma factor (sigma-70 family)
VMVNLHISRKRKERLQRLFLQRNRVADSSAGPTDHVESKVLVWEALAQLSVRQRAVVILRYIDDLSLEDTARALGCSVSTTNTHLRRARSALRSLLGDTSTASATASEQRR